MADDVATFNLRERLIAAKLAGRKTETGYVFNSNEVAADVAVEQVLAWLQEEVQPNAAPTREGES